jgi:chaperonin GroES
MQVLQDRVLVKRDNTEERTASGLILPTEAKEVPNSGVVVAVGKGRLSTETGVLMPMTVKEGDRVLFSRFGGQEVTVKEETYLVLREEEIFGILDGAE